MPEADVHSGLVYMCGPIFMVCIHYCSEAIVSTVLWVQGKHMPPPTGQQEAASGGGKEREVVTTEPVKVSDPAVQPEGPGLSSVVEKSEVVGGNASAKYADGGIYEGGWDDSVGRNGEGKMVWRNGNVYQGTWKGDRQEGRGIMTYWDGSRYNGEWQNGQRNGQGEMSWIDGGPYNGINYQGGWLNDKREGKGQLKDKNGGSYNGDWKADLASGVGKITWPNGNWYQGDVYDGKPDGRGAFVDVRVGRTVRGHFRGGAHISPCKMQ